MFRILVFLLRLKNPSREDVLNIKNTFLSFSFVFSFLLFFLPFFLSVIFDFHLEASAIVACASYWLEQTPNYGSQLLTSVGRILSAAQPCLLSL